MTLRLKFVFKTTYKSKPQLLASQLEKFERDLDGGKISVEIKNLGRQF